MNKLLQHILQMEGYTNNQSVPKAQKGKTVFSKQLIDYKVPSGYSNISNDNILSSKQLASEFTKQAQAKAEIANRKMLANRETVRSYDPEKENESLLSRLYHIAVNPMTALSYKTHGKDIPDHFERGEKNILESATNVINPFSYIDAGSRIPGNLARGEFAEAGLNALTVLPAAAEFKGAVPLIKNGSKVVKNVSSSSKSFGLNIDALKRLGRSISDPFNPNNLKANNAQEWMKDWYSDPETLARMEAYKAKPSGNYLKNEVKSTKDFIARDRYFNDPVINPIEDKNYIDLLKEKGLEKYLEHGTTSSGVSWGEPSSIYINRPSYFPFNKKGLESTKVHEATHAMESNGRMFNRREVGDLIEPFGFTEETYKNLKPSGPFALKNPKYYADPTEVHARMNETRYRLGLKPGDEMTKDMYNNAYKFDKFNGMGSYIKDHEKMRNLFNKFYVAAPLAIGAGAVGLPEKKDGGMILDPMGQWAHPGKNTRIPGSNITMKGVNYPVMGIGNNGMTQVMEPGGEYDFRDAEYVDEYPMMKGGGYVVTRSHDRKGKTHKVTGPDGTVKYFGDSKLGQHPNDPERKKAFYARHKKNLDNNPYFRAFARKTWQNGGQLDYNSILQQNAADAEKYPSAYHKDFVTGYPVVNSASAIQRPGGFDCPPGYTKYSNGDGTFSCRMTNEFPGTKSDLRGLTKVADDIQFYNQGMQRSLAAAPTRKNGGSTFSGNPFYENVVTNNPYFRAFARKTWEKGGETDDDKINDDKEMLSGVADILRRINDTRNRKEVANHMMENFRDEDVSFEPNAFLKSANVFGKGGEMIRRADGSYSHRGLWDNIRANKGSGKKPTKQMLEQERKIK